MPHNPEYQELQRRFAEFCRTDRYEEFPGIRSEERVRTYRRLVFNGVASTLGDAYPICRRVFGREAWSDFVEKFFAEYPCGSPILWRMPYGLVDYVEQTGACLDRYPHLRDLLHFEWIEIEVYMMENAEHPAFKTEGDAIESPLVLNPDFRLLQLEYPVYRASIEALQSAEEMERGKGSYFLLAARNPDTDKVEFVEISPLYLVLLEELERSPHGAHALLQRACAQFGLACSEEVLGHARQFIEELLAKRVLLGFLA